MPSKLEEAEAIVDSLSASERMQLMQYLDPVPKASSLSKNQPKTDRAEAIKAWTRLKQLGSEIANEPGDGKSASQILGEMRR